MNVPEKAEGISVLVLCHVLIGDFFFKGSIEVPLSVKDLSTQQSNTHGMHRVCV